MAENDPGLIAELIGAMASTYPNVTVSDQTNLTYVRMLRDIPIDILAVAIEQCTSECKWFPSVAEIRDKAMTLTRTESVPAFEAWAKVVAEIGRIGLTETAMIDGVLTDVGPEFADPIIAKAVDCIGWKALCNSENQIADRAHFAKVYDQLVARHEDDARLLPAARQLKQMTAGQNIAQILDRASRKEIAK